MSKASDRRDSTDHELGSMDYEAGRNRRAVAELVRSIVAVAHQDPYEPHRLLEKARSQLDELLAVPNLLTLGVTRQRVHSERSWWLYYDPWIKVAVATPQSEPITHDHGTWQVLAIYNGEVDYRAYERVDDGTVNGYGEITLADRSRYRRGDLIVIPPPPDDIHDWEPTVRETHLLAVHGPEMAALRRYFSPSSNHYVVREP